MENNTRFAHYTTADAAKKILENKQVWMRKTSCMNDYMEVRHGIDCLSKAYHGEPGQRLRATLNGIHNGIAEEVADLFDDWRWHFLNDTYIACFSEHSDKDDTYGRLSMWRAYSKSIGVALVLNNAPFLAHTGPRGVYSSPVLYLDDGSLEAEVQTVEERVVASKEFLQDQSRESVIHSVFNTFRFAALCIKHPGFKEEKEWRVIYAPAMEQSPYVQYAIQPVNGNAATHMQVFAAGIAQDRQL